ncbi:MAG: hypothetical protein LLP51_06875 [Halorhodospira halophila]|uniref:hypothetical protein n=1 Tax=Halorhodospira TaxID=85108 RepID=UPI001911C789|nr:MULTISPECIES: hypothetical protein [Halorhodospira]MBK5937590.1 hypothetical protein [Halorhodospira halophila]MBK5944685.1 hypothetical protein [Halorhodospira halophila]MCC3751102.1 hypothetical protein [Halorhodospira halophila]MCG5527170.1 hypothetical protein [Halorhodospira halophila]MCG5532987.1 hypothetical protein [Halorhodospira sp. 9621]
MQHKHWIAGLLALMVGMGSTAAMAFDTEGEADDQWEEPADDGFEDDGFDDDGLEFEEQDDEIDPWDEDADDADAGDEELDW